ncbi:MAG: hypothetical protein QG611_299 [Bacteroidota bacterium]|nr:hypothetical protein [Bacteroidota bacterium]
MIFHPVHVTLTSIDQVKGTDSLKVFVKMYFDDFLIDYKLFDEKSNVENVIKDQQFPADLMKKYLDEKVNIFVNNKQVKGKLLKLTMKDNEISINLLYRAEKKLKSITVRNLIMTSLYSDQANMTIIRVNDFEEGIKLTPKKTEQTFRLN